MKDLQYHTSFSYSESLSLSLVFLMLSKKLAIWLNQPAIFFMFFFVSVFTMNFTMMPEFIKIHVRFISTLVFIHFVPCG